MKLHKNVKHPRTINFFKKLENKFNKIHNNKYDYSLAIYQNSKTKIKIICKNHLVFEQRPRDHINGNGCPKCAVLKNTIKRRHSLEHFIKAAKAIHKNTYDYSLVDYKGSKKKVKIICKKHGAFFQAADDHITGKGCAKCGIIKRSSTKTLTTEEFITKAKYFYGCRYDYSLVDYIGSKKKVKIICKKHGIFTQTPNNHLKNYGCTMCATSGFDVFKSATLYYLSINNGEAYKIGVTNKTVRERFKKYDFEKMEIIKEWEYKSGQECLDAEAKLLREHKHAKWNGNNLLVSGNTELFTFDVLGLDKQNTYID